MRLVSREPQEGAKIQIYRTSEGLTSEIVLFGSPVSTIGALLWRLCLFGRYYTFVNFRQILSSVCGVFEWYWNVPNVIDKCN